VTGWLFLLGAIVAEVIATMVLKQVKSKRSHSSAVGG